MAILWYAIVGTVVCVLAIQNLHPFPLFSMESFIFPWLLNSMVKVRSILHSRLVSQGSAQFDPTEQTIESIHSLLFNGRVSCHQVVQGYLAKIEAINPLVNAVITLNPHALGIADGMDAALQGRNTTILTSEPLFCIPVFLKDNYDTVDMPTTAGSLSLESTQPIQDAGAVKKLKSAGAIILGKANMHEYALEGLTVSSLGGQTHNPYDLTRTPGGSSGGSGVCVASSFSTFATASDTVNSIRSPSASNSLFGIRPTRGLISRAGIVPLSYTQDAIGPIARSPRDLAIALDVMAGSAQYDPADNFTAFRMAHRPTQPYIASLTGKALRGARIGVLTTMFNYTSSNETTPVNVAVQQAIKSLAASGATIIDVTDPLLNSSLLLHSHDVQRFEFPSMLTEYLRNTASQGSHVPHLSFDTVYASQNFLPLCYREVLGDAAKTSIQSPEYSQRLAAHKDLQIRLFQEFAKNSLDAVVYPEQQNLVVPIGSLSQTGRNGILAAITGTPVVVVPAGFSPSTVSAPLGIPIGMEIMGLPFSEAKLLDLAYSYDLATQVRKTPMLAAHFVSGANITTVPVITPNRDVHANYRRIPPGFP